MNFTNRISSRIVRMYDKSAGRAYVLRDIKRFSPRNEWKFLCTRCHYRVVRVNGHDTCELRSCPRLILSIHLSFIVRSDYDFLRIPRYFMAGIKLAIQITSVRPCGWKFIRNFVTNGWLIPRFNYAPFVLLNNLLQIYSVCQRLTLIVLR